MLLRKHLGFPVFIAVAITGGVTARLLWDAVTGHQDPPIWAPVLVAALVVPMAMAVKTRVDRFAHRGPVR